MLLTYFNFHSYFMLLTYSMMLTYSMLRTYFIMLAYIMLLTYLMLLTYHRFIRPGLRRAARRAPKQRIAEAAEPRTYDRTNTGSMSDVCKKTPWACRTCEFFGTRGGFSQLRFTRPTCSFNQSPGRMNKKGGGGPDV